MHNDLISNLSYINAQQIILTHLGDGEPRKIIKQELQNAIKQNPNKTIVIGLRFIGRRLIDNRSTKEIIELVNGKRIRIYYGVYHKGKMHVKFAWHKLKYLSETEKAFLIKNFHNEIFETTQTDKSAKFLIAQTGGILIENLIYKYCNQYFIKNENT